MDVAERRFRRAVVADGYEFNRDALEHLLRGPLRFESVLQLASLDTSRRTPPDTSVDLVIFNLDLADHLPLTLIEVKLRFPQARWVVVAGSNDRDTIRDCLAAGVHGYIPLQLGSGEICSALETVIGGNLFLPCPVSELAMPTIEIDAGHSNGNPADLSPRQREVLKLLATGRSAKEIARELVLTPGTVRSHLSAIYHRLGVHDRIAAVLALSRHHILLFFFLF